MRYRNDGSMPLNYGDKGPWVEPGGEFDTADYPEISAAQLESHLASGFISEVVSVVDELHVHATRGVVDALTTAPGRREQSRSRSDAATAAGPAGDVG